MATTVPLYEAPSAQGLPPTTTPSPVGFVPANPSILPQPYFSPTKQQSIIPEAQPGVFVPTTTSSPVSTASAPVLDPAADVFQQQSGGLTGMFYNFDSYRTFF
jgi:hypothetical protein